VAVAVGVNVAVAVGVNVAVAAAVAVGVGLAVGVGPVRAVSTVSISSWILPSYPATTIKRFPIAVPPVKACGAFVLGPVVQLLANVS
jgi:hypothetical protein